MSLGEYHPRIDCKFGASTFDWLDIMESALAVIRGPSKFQVM
jgi:hypothetical protein